MVSLTAGERHIVDVYGDHRAGGTDVNITAVGCLTAGNGAKGSAGIVGSCDRIAALATVDNQLAVRNVKAFIVE